MKKLIVFFSILLILSTITIGAYMFIKKGSNKPVENDQKISSINSLVLGYSTGTMIYSSVRYDTKHHYRT